MTAPDTLILGIETSCDETAAALVLRRADGSGEILSNVIYSQIDEHAQYGGVVPEIAARAHVSILDTILKRAIDDSGHQLTEIDAIAATAGPGLIGGVLVGLMTAKAIAAALAKPLIAINHLEAHALTARLTDQVTFPYLLLLVSGGHSQIVLVRGIGDYDLWGTTIDDALGEAFDKTAKLLSLPYPGGPQVERHAANGNPKRFALPRPILNRPGLDFSFSGLKTAVRLAAESVEPVTEQDINDICASFQAAICDILHQRATRAINRFRDDYPDQHCQLVVAGGVAANKAIAASLTQVCANTGASLIVPPAALCTDNGVMIAWAGAERFALGLHDDFTFSPKARWPLADLTGANL